MGKVLLGPTTHVYPMPAFVIGANVNGKPNFMTAGWSGIVNGEPPMISVAIRPHRYTHKGITENSTFSVNIPSVDQAKEVDYCGIVSGAKANKAEVCKFNVFYGKLGNAPLIEQCPINLECKVMHTLKLGSHSLFIGQVEETHISENCLTNGEPDFKKINPIVYTTEPSRQYLAYGELIGKAYSIGLELKKRK